jgi:hypothetical protein
LQVGHDYFYHIRASARQPWRNSQPTTIRHTVQWQASIEGQVTLRPKAGALPIQNVIVEYRMEDLNGTVIDICDDEERTFRG